MRALRRSGWTSSAEAAFTQLPVDPDLIGRGPRADTPTTDGRWLVTVKDGRPVDVTNVGNGRLVDGRDPMGLWTFLRESVPVENLHIALDVVAWRSAVVLKFGPNGAPTPETLKTSAVGRFTGRRAP